MTIGNCCIHEICRIMLIAMYGKTIIVYANYFIQVVL